MSQFEPEAVPRIAFEVPSAGVQRHGGGGHARRLAKKGRAAQGAAARGGSRDARRHHSAARRKYIITATSRSAPPSKALHTHKPQATLLPSRTTMPLTPSVKMAARFLMMGGHMHPITFLIDLLLSIHGSQRFWFWVCMAFIAVGLIAIGANLMEPSKASF